MPLEPWRSYTCHTKPCAPTHHTARESACISKRRRTTQRFVFVCVVKFTACGEILRAPRSTCDHSNQLLLLPGSPVSVATCPAETRDCIVSHFLCHNSHHQELLQLKQGMFDVARKKRMGTTNSEARQYWHASVVHKESSVVLASREPTTVDVTSLPF